MQSTEVQSNLLLKADVVEPSFKQAGGRVRQSALKHDNYIQLKVTYPTPSG